LGLIIQALSKYDNLAGLTEDPGGPPVCKDDAVGGYEMDSELEEKSFRKQSI